MAWLHRLAVLGCFVAMWAAVLTLLDPNPPQAKANVACDFGVGAAAAVTGAFANGNPLGDACNAVTDPVLGAVPNPLDPLKDAAASIGQGVFDQITTWAADGAVWLLGRVVVLTSKTTSPNLLSKGFLRQYRQMAQIAVVLALLMVLFAVLESLGRGDGGMLVRVFLVNVPLAALATSAAYVVVGLLIATTDGFSEAIAHATADDTRAFFKSAIEGLAGTGAAAGSATGGAGAGTATGAVAVPLFVGFIVAIVAAFAAFLVWIELLMRDAAIYAVALFMPLAIAASIWPRWTSALRRTAELLIVVVFSKFVIVSIIALAASLLANTGGKVEHVLAAGALLLLACFAPVVLFRLIPFAEGAVSSAYNRQSAGAASARAVRASTSLQMVRQSALSNWAAQGPKGAGDVGGSGTGGGAPSKGRPGRSGGEAAGASGGAAGAAALPVAAGATAAKGTKAAAAKLAGTGTAQASGETSRDMGGSTDSGKGTTSREAGGKRTPRPRAETSAPGAQAPSSSTNSAPEPTQATGGKAPGEGARPPRPSGDAGAPSRDGSAAKGKS